MSRFRVSLAGGPWTDVGSAPVVVPPAATKIALIGDSTLFQDGFGEARMRALLSPTFAAENIFFYAASGKDIFSADSNGFNTLTNITQARTALGGEPDLWLINLGANGHNTTDSDINYKINLVMSELTAPVLWNALSQKDGYDAPPNSVATRLNWNTKAGAKVDTYTNGRWMDWHAYVKAKPGGDASLWNADGVHMTVEGYAYKNGYNFDNLVDAAAALTPVVPPVVVPGVAPTIPSSYPYPAYTDRAVHSYASLYQSGDSLSTVLNTRLAAVGGGYVTLPNGFDEEIVDFLQGGNSYSLYAPHCYGLWGNGPEQARIKLKAGSSTQASRVPLQSAGGINPLSAMRISPANSGNQVQVHMYGLTLEGGDVGHTYNGLFINWNGAGSTYEHMKLKGFGLADWNSPPGETNMLNIYNGGGVTLRGIEADGFLSNGVRAGAAFATNGPTSATFEDVYVHDTLYTGCTFGTGGDIFTGTLSRNIITTRYSTWNNASHFSGSGTSFAGLNHEGVDDVKHYFPNIRLTNPAQFQRAHVTINNSQKSSKILIHEPEWNDRSAPWAYGCFSASTAIADYPDQKQLMSDMTVIKNGITLNPVPRNQASTANPLTDFIYVDTHI